MFYEPAFDDKMFIRENDLKTSVLGDQIIMSNSKKYKDSYYPVRKVSDLKDMINSSAELYGDRAAYLIKRTPGGKYTPVSYKQFKYDIDAMGTALIDLGLKGKHIGVIGETRYEWLAGHLAVANGTGVVVPLDKELPEAELENLMERAHLSAIIYSGKVEKSLLKVTGRLEGLEYIISMDAEKSDEDRLSFWELVKTGRNLIAKGNRSFTDAEIDPEAMSILLFTSGTTGLARGVMLSHKNIVSNVMGMSMFVHVGADDVSLSILPVHHTYEFTCNHMTVLYQGGTLAICEGLKHIVKNMNECKATILIGVPLVFEMMHNRVWKQAEKTGKADKLKAGLALARKLDRFNIKSMRKLFKDVHNAFGGHMRLFISGAAAMDPEIIDNFNYMGINMFQGYGMTENSPIIAVHRDRYHTSASVGPAMPDTQIKIYEPDVDGIGEVITKSDSVMIGYYENEEETARVLRGGWLYTGDYGYLDENGFLYITGRKKNVIVTKNGKNVFPEEVEYYLMKSPYIKEVLVDGDERPDGEIIVTAHIVPEMELISEREGELDAEQLKKLFKKVIDDTNDQMSSYKRVKRFEIRDAEFEKTSTRKIKRFGANTEK